MTASKQDNALSKAEAHRRVKRLRDEIEHHDFRYYIQDDPEISDAQYDRLKRRGITIPWRLVVLGEVFTEMKAFAKFNRSQDYLTRIRSSEAQVGRTGALIAVATLVDDGCHPKQSRCLVKRLQHHGLDPRAAKRELLLKGRR